MNKQMNKNIMYTLGYTLFFITADFKGNVKLLLLSPKLILHILITTHKTYNCSLLLFKISSFIFKGKNLYHHNNRKSDLTFKPRID